MTGSPGPPALFPESRAGGPGGSCEGAEHSAQLVEDEDYQLRYERVAGIDVAKAKADVCTRLPPGVLAALIAECLVRVRAVRLAARTMRRLSLFA
jgi:hypothetical protein